MGERVDLHIVGHHLPEAIGASGIGSVFRAVVETAGKDFQRPTRRTDNETG